MELETWLSFMHRLVKVDRTSNFCMQASACSIISIMPFQHGLRATPKIIQ